MWRFSNILVAKKIEVRKTETHFLRTSFVLTNVLTFFLHFFLEFVKLAISKGQNSAAKKFTRSCLRVSLTRVYAKVAQKTELKHSPVAKKQNSTYFYAFSRRNLSKVFMFCFIFLIFLLIPITTDYLSLKKVRKCGTWPRRNQKRKAEMSQKMNKKEKCGELDFCFEFWEWNGFLFSVFLKINETALLRDQVFFTILATPIDIAPTKPVVSRPKLRNGAFRFKFLKKKGWFKKAFWDRNRAPNRELAFWNEQNGANEDGDILTVPKARSTQIAAPNFRTARSTKFSLVCIFRWTIFDEAKCEIAKISILAKQNYALSFFESLFFSFNFVNYQNM